MKAEADRIAQEHKAKIDRENVKTRILQENADHDLEPQQEYQQSKASSNTATITCGGAETHSANTGGETSPP
jgi:hypothetical protein